MSIKPKKIINNLEAKKIFNVLIAALEEENKLNDSTILIVNNFAYLEQMKQMFHLDINQRGVMELFKNGSQEYYKENKSVANVLKIVESQRKLQAELKLTPATDKKITEVIEEKVDEFDEF